MEAPYNQSESGHPPESAPPRHPLPYVPRCPYQCAGSGRNWNHFFFIYFVHWNFIKSRHWVLQWVRLVCRKRCCGWHMESCAVCLHQSLCCSHWLTLCTSVSLSLQQLSCVCMSVCSVQSLSCTGGMHAGYPSEMTNNLNYYKPVRVRLRSHLCPRFLEKITLWQTPWR